MKMPFFRVVSIQRWKPLLLGLCGLFLVLGCTTAVVRDRAAGTGQVTLFLNGPDDSSSADITFVLSAVNLVAEDGTARALLSSPVKINSLALKGGQMLLGERLLPEGRYRRLQLLVREAKVKRDDRVVSLALPPEGIVEIDVDVRVREGRNTSVFLLWDGDASLAGGYLFAPHFTVRLSTPQLSTLLVYVTNEGSDNVSVINRQSGKVVATVMVGESPRGIAAGLRRDRMKVYVANSGSDSISVIDPTSNRVEQEIPIRFGRVPEGIAVAGVPFGRELIFVANYGSNTVSVVDAATYREVDRVDVGSGPVAIVTDPPVESFLGSRFLSIEEIDLLSSYRDRYLNVYVANRNSNDVSVLRMDLRRDRIEEIGRIAVEWTPVSLAVDPRRGLLYVANHGSDRLSVIDLLEVVEGDLAGAVTTVGGVGMSITGIAVDSGLDRVYLLRESPGEVMAIRPPSGGEGSSSMPVTVGTITIGGAPRAVALDPEERKLYIVDRERASVHVVDKAAGKVERVVPVGRRPYGVALLPY